MNHKIYWITFVAVMGGFIFGLNMAGISGAVNSIRDVFDLSDGGLGLVVSALTIGCLVGSLFTGGRWAARWPPTAIHSSFSACWPVSPSVPTR